MVENTPRSEQMFEKAKRENPVSATPGAWKEKVSKMFSEVRGLFGMPQAKGGAKAGPNAPKDDGVLAALFSAQKIDLKSINQTLAVILAGLVALTGYVLFRKPSDISAVSAAVSKIKFEPLEEGVITPFEQLTFYLEQIKKRDIFNEYKEYVPPPPPAKAEEPPPPPKVTIQEKAKNLKLMGISLGASPKVIIQDAGANEVHFLEEGQKIKGTEIKVKKILKTEVIIESDGEEMKLL
jgi:hypothetical protein